MSVSPYAIVFLLIALAVLSVVITVVTLIVSRKYLKTRISLSLEVERDPNPQHPKFPGT